MKPSPQSPTSAPLIPFREWFSGAYPAPTAIDEPIALTFESPLTAEQVADLRKAWLLHYRGRIHQPSILGGAPIVETRHEYLARIIARMDWHVERLRRLG